MVGSGLVVIWKKEKGEKGGKDGKEGGRKKKETSVNMEGKKRIKK